MPTYLSFLLGLLIRFTNRLLLLVLALSGINGDRGLPGSMLRLPLSCIVSREGSVNPSCLLLTDEFADDVLELCFEFKLATSNFCTLSI